MVKDGYKEDDNNSQEIIPFQIGDLGMSPAEGTLEDVVPQSGDLLDAYKGMTEIVDSREMYETAEAIPKAKDTKPYAREIIDESPNHITVFGKDAKSTAYVAYDIAKARHESDTKESDAPKTTSVLSLNFGVKKPYLTEVASNDGKVSIDSRLLDEGGILTHLSSKEQGELFGRNFGDKRDDELTVQNIYTTVADTLTDAQRENRGDDYKPSLEEMRDAMQVLDSARVTKGHNEAPTLKNPRVRQAVEASLRADYIKANESTIRSMAQRLDSLVPDQKTQVVTLKPQSEADNDIVVTNISVNGQGSSLEDQQKILSTLSIPLITEKSPLGKPEVLFIQDAQNMHSECLSELEQHCEAQGITLVSSQSSLNKDSSTGDLLVIGKISDPKLGSSISELIGSQYGSQIESNSWGATVNRNPSTPNWSINLEDDGTIKGGSVSGSSGPSEGGSWNVGESLKWGDHPILPATALGDIALGEVVVVAPMEQPRGIFDIISGEKKGEFPPIREPEKSNMQDRVREIISEIEPKALEEKGQYLDPNQVREVVRGSSSDGLLPRQRLTGLLSRYSSANGGKSGLKQVQPLALVHPDSKAKTDDFLMYSVGYWEKDFFEGKTELGFNSWAEENNLTKKDIAKARRLMEREFGRQNRELPDYFYYDEQSAIEAAEE